METIVAPVHLAIRADRENNAIAAFCQESGTGKNIFFISSMNIHLADANKEVFDAWVAGVSEMFRIFIKDATGAECKMMPPEFQNKN